MRLERMYGAWVNLEEGNWNDPNLIPSAKEFLTESLNRTPVQLGKFRFVVDPVRQSVSAYAYKRRP